MALRLQDSRKGWAGADMTITKREKQILQAIADHGKYPQVAKVLEMNHDTLHEHCRRIFEKFGVWSKLDLIYKAWRVGLIQ